MNREIKFRVYDKDLKKMRYLNSSHDFICFDEKGNGYYHNMQTGLGEWFSDLMQYTGLKDKYGVEIYEGDKVNIQYQETIVKNAIIEYKGASFYGATDYDYWELDEYLDIEIVGNIYEDKEVSE